MAEDEQFCVQMVFKQKEGDPGFFSSIEFAEFPEATREGLRDFKKCIDESFRGFTREWGESIEGFFFPLLKFLGWF